MTVHCPTCGHPVDFEPTVKGITVADMNHLTVQVTSGYLVEHRCAPTPQDQPSTTT